MHRCTARKLTTKGMQLAAFRFYRRICFAKEPWQQAYPGPGFWGGLWHNVSLRDTTNSSARVYNQ